MKSVRKQILQRLTINFFLITILFGMIIYGFEQRRFHRDLEAVKISLEALVKAKENTLGHMVFFRNSFGLESALENIRNYPRIIDAEVFDSSGILFYATGKRGPSEWDERFKGEPGIHRERYRGQPALSYTVPLSAAGEKYGILRLHYNLEALEQELLYSALLYSLLVLALFLASLILVARMLRHQITLPLGELSTTMQRVGQGELGLQADIRVKNEIALMAEAFNGMSRENAQMYDKLEKINRSLESRIQVRTEELNQSRTLLQSVLNSSHDSIMVLRSVHGDNGEVRDFEWLMANPRASAHFASEVGEIIGKKVLSSSPSVKEEDFFQDLKESAEKGEPFIKDRYLEFENMRGWFQISAAVINEGLAVTFHDITRRKQLQLDLERQAGSDGLTGLANRAYFDRYLKEQWELCAQERQPLALLFLDVDYFKKYNDRYGHGRGDECLKTLAVVFKSHAARPLDCAARYGGEEFVLLLPRISRQGAEETARSIQRELERLGIPHEDSDISENVSVSIGISIMAPSGGGEIRELVETADRALYQAKNEGRNRFAVL